LKIWESFVGGYIEKEGKKPRFSKAGIEARQVREDGKGQLGKEEGFILAEGRLHAVKNVGTMPGSYKEERKKSEGERLAEGKRQPFLTTELWNNVSVKGGWGKARLGHRKRKGTRAISIYKKRSKKITVSVYGKREGGLEIAGV